MDMFMFRYIHCLHTACFLSCPCLGHEGRRNMQLAIHRQNSAAGMWSYVQTASASHDALINAVSVLGKEVMWIPHHALDSEMHFMHATFVCTRCPQEFVFVLQYLGWRTPWQTSSANPG